MPPPPQLFCTGRYNCLVWWCTAAVVIFLSNCSRPSISGIKIAEKKEKKRCGDLLCVWRTWRQDRQSLPENYFWEKIIMKEHDGRRFFFFIPMQKRSLEIQPCVTKSDDDDRFFFAHSWNKRSFWQSQVRARGLTANFLRVLSNHSSSSCTWGGRRGDCNETEGDILQIFPHTREPPSPPHTCIESCHQRTKYFLPCPRQKRGKEKWVRLFLKYFPPHSLLFSKAFFPRESGGGGGGNWVAALRLVFNAKGGRGYSKEKRRENKGK